MAKANKTVNVLRGVEQTEIPSVSQDLATRIWNGQSPDVPIIERVSRIANALKDKGFDLDITLPHEDAERLLNAHR